MNGTTKAKIWLRLAKARLRLRALLLLGRPLVLGLSLFLAPQSLAQYNLGAFWRGPQQDNRLILVVNTNLSAGTTVTLPLNGMVDVTIDWGDATANTTCPTVVTTAGDLSCVYPSDGIYTISISGTLTQFGTAAGYPNVHRIVRIQSWGNLGLTSLSGAFRNGQNLLEIAPIPNSVTNLSSMFANAIFNLDISDWDTSNVTNMAYMFLEAGSFNQPIGSWNTSNVLDMGGMFALSVFNQPIGDWDVSNVTNMASMFEENIFFNQPIGNWNVANVTNMEGMFAYSSFNQNISYWNTSNVSSMNFMFYSASIFNQFLGCWSVPNIPAEPSLFSDFSSLSAANKPNWGGSGCIPSTTTTLYASSFDSNVFGTMANPENAQGTSDAIFTSNTSDSWTARWQMTPLPTPVMTQGLQSVRLRLRRAGAATASPRVTAVAILNSDNTVLKEWTVNQQITSVTGTNFILFGPTDLDQSAQNLKVQIETQRGVDYSLVGQTLYASSFQADIVGAVTNPNNALGAPDGTFTGNTGNSDWTAQWNLSPITGMGPEDTVGGTQNITLHLRKHASGGGTPTVNWVDLYQNGVLVQRIHSTAFDVTSNIGVDLSINFDGALLNGPENVAIVLETQARGAGANNRSIQLDAITWNANYLTPSAATSAVQVDSIQLDLGHE